MTLLSRTSLILLLAVALAACQKKTMLSTVEEVPYLCLPASIAHLHSVDMSRLRATQLFQDQVAQAKQESKRFNRLLTDFTDKVGFNPIDDIDFVSLAFRGALKPNQPLGNKLFIARGRFTGMAGKLDSLRQWLGYEFLLQPPPFQKRLHRASNVTIYYLTAHSQFNERIEYQILIALPSDDLMIVGFAPDNMDATLDVLAAIKGIEGLHNNPAWIKKLAFVKTTSTLWGIGDFNASPEVKAAFAVLPDSGAYDKIQNYLYNIDSDSEFRVEFGFVCAANDEAIALTGAIEKARGEMRNNIATVFGPDAPELTKLPDKLLITPNQNTSRMILRLQQTDVDTIVPEIKKNRLNLWGME